MSYRAIDRTAAQTAVVAARRAGMTLTAASAAAGVHTATTCRWQAADPAFADALRAAVAAAGRDRHSAAAVPEPASTRDPPGGFGFRPRVSVHPGCPTCGRLVEVRKAPGGAPFWRCSGWPTCGWASWRPRSPWACSGCGGATLWTHSRSSVGCVRCGHREGPGCE